MDKVLVVFNNSDFLTRVQTTLENRGIRVLALPNIVTVGALRQIQPFSPDVAFVDELTSPLGRFELVSLLRQIAGLHSLPILMYGPHNLMLSAFEIGIDDYVSKLEPSICVARIRVLLRRKGEKFVSPVLVFKHLTICPDDQSVIVGINKVYVSSQLYKLLRLLSKSPNTPIGRRKICRHIWGKWNKKNENSLRVLINRLRSKIDDRMGTIIGAVEGIGYVFND